MPATKIDFKDELHALYFPDLEPVLLDVPDMAFLMIDGQGDPNSSDAYREAIEALYSLSYTTKFTVKNGHGIDFKVMPLECLWWTSDSPEVDVDDKSRWSWTAMIMQPDPVTEEVVELARAKAGAKRSLPALESIRFERFHEGLAAQVMHLGPYSEEAPTIERLHAFVAEQGYVLAGKHHEIYLGDPRRSAPEKLRTVIRQPVAAA